MAYRHQHQYRSPFGDTTYTKVFVGGLAWETPTDRMREYFEQFGDILEAVIITDKNTGKSKGYGFVTFRDPDSANRACEIANPMIDGRRANCNIASFGRPRPSPPRGQGGPSSPPPPQQRYGGVPTPAMHPMAPHPAANAFYYQSNYGYTPYAPGYGYHQAMYNPQYQQAQYYPQALGGSGGTSSLNMNMNMSSPYGYGYPYSGSRATYYHPAHAQRMPHMYYPQPQPQPQLEMDQVGPSPTPYSPAAATSTPTINPSNLASLQNPPPITSLQPSFSPSSDSQHKERTSTETDAVVVTSGGSSVQAPFN